MNDPPGIHVPNAVAFVLADKVTTVVRHETDGARLVESGLQSGRAVTASARASVAGDWRQHVVGIHAVNAMAAPIGDIQVARPLVADDISKVYEIRTHDGDTAGGSPS